MSRSGFPWWFLAIALSLLLHLLLFLELGPRQVIATAPTDLARATHVRLAFQPPPPQPELEIESKPEPEPVLKPVVEAEPEPVIELEAKSEPKPKAEPKPKPKPKTKPKPKLKNNPKPVTPAPAITQAAPQKRQTAPVVAPQPRDHSAAGRERYLATLLSLIEQQKVYPKIARRRDIQGNVQVAFTVACNGSITGLQTSNGHKVLQKSARKAVQKALPLPRPPTENPCPVKVKYAMVFKLN